MAQKKFNKTEKEQSGNNININFYEMKGGLKIWK